MNLYLHIIRHQPRREPAPHRATLYQCARHTRCLPKSFGIYTVTLSSYAVLLLERNSVVHLLRITERPVTLRVTMGTTPAATNHACCRTLDQRRSVAAIRVLWHVVLFRKSGGTREISERRHSFATVSNPPQTSRHLVYRCTYNWTGTFLCVLLQYTVDRTVLRSVIMTLHI